MCYETPESSPVSYLLDKSAWDHLADAINTALLGNDTFNFFEDLWTNTHISLY